MHNARRRADDSWEGIGRLLREVGVLEFSGKERSDTAEAHKEEQARRSVAYYYIPALIGPKSRQVWGISAILGESSIEVVWSWRLLYFLRQSTKHPSIADGSLSNGKIAHSTQLSANYGCIWDSLRSLAFYYGSAHGRQTCWSQWLILYCLTQHFPNQCC